VGAPRPRCSASCRVKRSSMIGRRGAAVDERSPRRQRLARLGGQLLDDLRRRRASRERMPLAGPEVEPLGVACRASRRANGRRRQWPSPGREDGVDHFDLPRVNQSFLFIRGKYQPAELTATLPSARHRFPQTPRSPTAAHIPMLAATLTPAGKARARAATTGDRSTGRPHECAGAGVG
jgi:hypothetical protein